MSVNEAYNYTNIDEKICTAGLLSEEQLSCLDTEGYRHVINLLPDDSQYAVVMEREIISAQGIEYHYIPVDFAAPRLADYELFNQVLNDNRGEKMLIHCAANFRVSAFFSRYAMCNMGWTQQQADELVASLWKPEEHSPWPQFMAQITAQ